MRHCRISPTSRAWVAAWSGSSQRLSVSCGSVARSNSCPSSLSTKWTSLEVAFEHHRHQPGACRAARRWNVRRRPGCVWRGVRPRNRGTAIAPPSRRAPATPAHFENGRPEVEQRDSCPSPARPPGCPGPPTMAGTCTVDSYMFHFCEWPWSPRAVAVVGGEDDDGVVQNAARAPARRGSRPPVCRSW